MARWLLKTEPSDYSFADLMRDKRAVWDGITAAPALIHLRAVRKGDLALIYHTGDEKRIVGIAEVARGAYPDPNASDARLVVIDLKPKRALRRPVTLAQIKADARFKNFALVRISRLSVMPVPDDLWDTIRALAEESLESART